MLTFTGRDPLRRPRRCRSACARRRARVAIAGSAASSRASRLTVTRFKPAPASARALPASSTPLVVSATSSIPSMPTSISNSRSRPRRSSGSPPVSRSLSTPCAAKHPRQARDLLEAQELRRGPGTRSPARRPLSACSSRSAGCSDRSPRCAGHAEAGRAGRASPCVLPDSGRQERLRKHVLSWGGDQRRVDRRLRPGGRRAADLACRRSESCSSSPVARPTPPNGPPRRLRAGSRGARAFAGAAACLAERVPVRLRPPPSR